LGTIGKYQILKTLGNGASSVIKLGYDTESKRHFALKILTEEWVNNHLKTV
jgi:hypothetical protein